MRNFYLLIIFGLGLGFSESGLSLPSHSRVYRACQSGETWGFSLSIPKEVRVQYRRALKGKLSEALSYSEALALEKRAHDTQLKTFAQYWVARALFEKRFLHLAEPLFEAIAEKSPHPEIFGIQVGALDCLNRIHATHPRILPWPKVEGNLKKFSVWIDQSAWKKEGRAVLLETLSHLILAEMGHGPSPKRMGFLMGFLQEDDSLFHLARGLSLTEKKEYSAAADELEKYFKKDRPDYLDRYEDPVRLTLARLYYQMDQFPQAKSHFQKIRKDSNHMVRAISEIAWVHLITDQYDEAVGAALSLTKGGLGNTFSPDGIMVLSMAFSELCQYSPALKAVQFFHKTYRPTYDWLTAHLRDQPYPLLTNYLRGTQSPVPPPILTEWARSSVFITHQDEINRYLDFEKEAGAFLRAQLEEGRRLGVEITELATNIRERLQKFREENRKKKSPDPLPHTLVADQKKLKDLKNLHAHLRTSNIEFKKVANQERTRIPGKKAALVAAINGDLLAKNQRMLSKLNSIVENIYLLKIEIYNGASQDIVWKEAHPDYHQFAQNLKERMESGLSDRVLNWGQSTQEVWIDELGNLTAQVYDNCASKDRYLAVQYDDPPLDSP